MGSSSLRSPPPGERRCRRCPRPLLLPPEAASASGRCSAAPLAVFGMTRRWRRRRRMTTITHSMMPTTTMSCCSVVSCERLGAARRHHHRHHRNDGMTLPMRSRHHDYLCSSTEGRNTQDDLVGRAAAEESTTMGSPYYYHLLRCVRSLGDERFRLYGARPAPPPSLLIDCDERPNEHVMVSSGRALRMKVRKSAW